MFQVLDNGKPADSSFTSISKGVGWDNSVFDTFEDAIKYANDWLGSFSHPDLKSLLKGNNSYCYNGTDTIEIRELTADKARQEYIALERKAWDEYEKAMEPFSHLKRHDSAYIDAHNAARDKYNAAVADPQRAYLNLIRKPDNV